jgi:hypothetical protein
VIEDSPCQLVLRQVVFIKDALVIECGFDKGWKLALVTNENPSATARARRSVRSSPLSTPPRATGRPSLRSPICWRRWRSRSSSGRSRVVSVLRAAALSPAEALRAF